MKSNSWKIWKKRLRPSAATLAGLLAVAVIFIAWGQVQRTLWEVSMRRYDALVNVLGDAMLIILPYWWLRGRWRWSVLVPVIAVPLFLMANLLYYRNFRQLIPFSTIFFTANFTERAYSNIPNLFRASDWLYILLPVAYTAYFIACRKRIVAAPRKLPRNTQWIATGVTLLFFIWGQINLTIDNYRMWQQSKFPRTVTQVLGYRYLYSNTTIDWMARDCGLPVYLVKAALLEIFTSHKVIEYTDQERREIVDFLDQMERLRQPAPFDFSVNRDKNLILIVVESLNGDVIDKRIGPDKVEVTPTLNALFHATGTIGCNKVVSQIAVGGSSDGILLYNTGMLPLRRDAYATVYPQLNLMALPKLYPWAESAEIICEEKTSWNHVYMTERYGYDALHDRADLMAAGLDWEKVGNDVAVMEYASRQVSKLKQPFLLEITSLSMHLPFNEPQVLGSIPQADLAGIAEAEARYYQSCRFFDRQLAYFIDALKRQGLYDNSVIVIVGDHNTPVDAGGYEIDNEYTPGETAFMALNTGYSCIIDHTVGQVDIFPTVLDIMDIGGAPGSWRGLGLSIFNPLVTSAVDKNGKLGGRPSTDGMEQMQRRAWEVSELMLRGAWFDPQAPK